MPISWVFTLPTNSGHVKDAPYLVIYHHDLNVSPVLLACNGVVYMQSSHWCYYCKDCLRVLNLLAIDLSYLFLNHSLFCLTFESHNNLIVSSNWHSILLYTESRNVIIMSYFLKTRSHGLNVFTEVIHTKSRHEFLTFSSSIMFS